MQSNFTTEETTWQLLQRQFNQITAKKPVEDHFSAATAPANQLKNQSFDFLPIDATRTKLSVVGEEEGSDYINASWIPGFLSLNEFLLTQHPKEATIPDFWRLLWEQDVHTVVVLSPVADPDSPVFWPESQQLRLGVLAVRHTEEGLLSGFQTKDFRLECGESTPRVVRMVFCPEWSMVEEGGSLGLLQVVHTRQDNLPPRPLAVLDREGGTQAAAFCALSSLLRQLHSDRSVDIYSTAKTIHNARPGVWLRPEHVLQLYRAVEALVGREARQQPEGREARAKEERSPSKAQY